MDGERQSKQTSNRMEARMTRTEKEYGGWRKSTKATQPMRSANRMTTTIPTAIAKQRRLAWEREQRFGIQCEFVWLCRWSLLKHACVPFDSVLFAITAVCGIEMWTIERSYRMAVKLWVFVSFIRNMRNHLHWIANAFPLQPKKNNNWTTIPNNHLSNDNINDEDERAHTDARARRNTFIPQQSYTIHFHANIAWHRTYNTLYT